MSSYKWLGWVGLFGAAAAAWKILQRRRKQTLHGRVALITGASAGIGRAAAHAFAAEGCHVALVARRAEALEVVAKELDGLGVRTLVIPADLTQDAALQHVVERTVLTFGRIDVLVNNAGLAMGGLLQEQEPARLQRMLELNVYSVIRLTQLTLPVMLRQGGGHIVNVGSMMGLIAPPGATAYAATRLAILGFSDALRREVRPRGIHVSAVLPGWTQTDMTGQVSLDKLRAAGYLAPLTDLDPPEVPAQAILDAVRYRMRTVMMGGPQMLVGGWASRLAPVSLDLYFAWFSDPQHSADALHSLGALP